MTSAKKENTHLIVVTLDCGSDFAFHQSLYEKHFNIYENRLLLKQGERRIDQYIVNVDKDINYILKKEEWKHTLLIYKVEKGEQEIDLYLVVNNEERYLSSFEIIEIYKDSIKISIWDRFIKLLKNLFK